MLPRLGVSPLPASAACSSPPLACSSPAAAAHLPANARPRTCRRRPLQADPLQRLDLVQVVPQPVVDVRQVFRLALLEGYVAVRDREQCVLHTRVGNLVAEVAKLLR